MLQVSAKSESMMNTGNAKMDAAETQTFLLKEILAELKKSNEVPK